MNTTTHEASIEPLGPPEAFWTPGGVRRPIRLGDAERASLDQLVRRTCLSRSEVLRRLAASVAPGLRGRKWATAMRAGIVRWDESGEAPRRARGAS